MKKNAKRYLGGAVVVLAAAGAWLLAGPSQLGGPVTYVAVTGTSMEPEMHTGDLVIVRKASEYQVGDVVAVRNEQLRSTVLHRIIAVEDGRFVVRGDSNDFVDTYRARPEDIVGRRWILLGQVGRIVELVRTPAGAAVLVVVIAAIAMSGTHKRRKSTRAGREMPGGSWLHGSRGPTMVTAAAAACAFALLGAFAFTRSTVRTETTKIPYSEAGRFAYSGPAEKGAVYPSGRVETGQPVYLKLVKDLEFEFDYTLKTDAPEDVEGSGLLKVELGDGTGWSRDFFLAQETAFQGTHWRAKGVLHLQDVRRLMARVQKDTEVFRDFFTLRVVPRVAIAGTIGERDFSSEFTPALSFQVGALEMQVTPDAATSSATPDQGDPLQPSQGGAVVAPLETPNSLAVLGINLDVSKARIVASAGVALSLALLALLGLMVRAPRRDEPARIEARFGSMIVEVESVTADPATSVVEVREIDALVALARRYDRAVLHEYRSGLHRYVVENEGTLYTYNADPTVGVDDSDLLHEADADARSLERAEAR